ncbi:DnaJ domain-containing protein [Marinobacter daqiaonensis]|nr:DnaJ domain-containing protein [Marinobacter daqiaonensis]
MSGREPQALSSGLRDRLDELLAEFDGHHHQPSKLLAEHTLSRGGRRILFFCLGYIAKADGRVTESDIRYAENLMVGLELSGKTRRQAIRHFQQGRDCTDLPGIRLVLWRLLGRTHLRKRLLIGLCLFHGAQLPGPPRKPRRYRCEDAFFRLELPMAAIDYLSRWYREHVWISEPPPKPETLQDAYRILGVDARTSFAEIKRAYRREVSRYHPDKLGQDLSPPEQVRARDQLLRLQQAWDVIKRRDRLTR